MLPYQGASSPHVLPPTETQIFLPVLRRFVCRKVIGFFWLTLTQNQGGTIFLESFRATARRRCVVRLRAGALRPFNTNPTL